MCVFDLVTLTCSGILFEHRDKNKTIKIVQIWNTMRKNYTKVYGCLILLNVPHVSFERKWLFHDPLAKLAQSGI